VVLCCFLLVFCTSLCNLRKVSKHTLATTFGAAGGGVVFLGGAFFTTFLGAGLGAAFLGAGFGAGFGAAFLGAAFFTTGLVAAFFTTGFVAAFLATGFVAAFLATFFAGAFLLTAKVKGAGVKAWAAPATRAAARTYFMVTTI
jgi:hypothetical protein